MTKQTAQRTLQDFVFGGIESDDTRLLATERARHRGLRHEQRIQPLDPRPGDPVTLTVTVGPDMRADKVTAAVTVDGSDPAVGDPDRPGRFLLPLARMDVCWEPAVWDYVEVWQGLIPGQPAGTLVQYRIHGEDALTGAVHQAREQGLDGQDGPPALYGYHVDRFAPPGWAQDAVIYQIFVDRFAKGETGAPVQEGWLRSGALEDFAGGNLQGVTARLPYIADLGVTAVWLTPIFAAASYHGYDTVDYTRVDPRFGSEADLHRLVDEAHGRGLRVILDFVANHTSDQSPIFQAAAADPASPYRDWFTFGPQFKHGYRCFFDVASMPQFNTDNPAVRRHLMDAACYWLDAFDVDGYRLDYAAGPSHSFWSEFQAACRAVKPDCWLFGEVTRTGDMLRSYVGRLDGCLDFNFLRRVRQLCAGPTPQIPLSRFVRHLEASRRFFPDGFLLPSFLDNHDTNRFLWAAENDPRRLRLALGLLFAFGGPPILYYGTEIGLSQPRAKGPWREEARHPMVWGAGQDQELLAFTRELIRLRREHPALRQGELITHFLDDERGVWLAERRWGADRVGVAVNLSQAEQPAPSLPAWPGRLPSTLPPVSCLVHGA